MDLGSDTVAFLVAKILPGFAYTYCADPWSIVINVNDHLRNGPGIRTSIGRLDFPGYILGRDNVRCGPVGMHTERPAY